MSDQTNDKQGVNEAALNRVNAQPLSDDETAQAAGGFVYPNPGRYTCKKCHKQFRNGDDYGRHIEMCQK